MNSFKVKGKKVLRGIHLSILGWLRRNLGKFDYGFSNG